MAEAGWQRLVAIVATVLVALLTTACGASEEATDSAPAASDQAQTASVQPGQVSVTLPAAGAATLPFSAALAFVDMPGTGQQVPLQVSLYTERGAMIKVIVDELPPEVNLIQGDRHWEACLGEEESKSFELLLGFPQDGTFRLGAMVFAEVDGVARYEQQHQLDIQVTKAGATVSHHQPQTRTMPAGG